MREIGIVVDQLGGPAKRGPGVAAHQIMRRLATPDDSRLWAIHSPRWRDGEVLFDAVPLAKWTKIHREHVETARIWQSLTSALRRIGRLWVPAALKPVLVSLWMRINALFATQRPPGPALSAPEARLALSELDVLLSFLPEDTVWDFPTERTDTAMVCWFWDAAGLRLANTPYERQSKHREELRNLIGRKLPLICRRAHVILCPSRSSDEDLRSYWPECSGKSRVVYLGQDTSSLQRLAEAGLKRRKIRRLLSAPFMLFLSGMSPNKNIENVLAAVAEIGRRTGQRPTLVMAGENIGSAEFRRHYGTVLTRARRSARIVLLDFVEDDTVCALMSRASMLVSPSFVEGFGLPMVEAMALGCLVICSDQFSQPEVGGDCVWACNPYDAFSIANAIEKVLNLTPEERRSAIERARQHVQRFSWDRSAADVGNIIRQLLDKKAARKATECTRNL